MMCPIEKHSFSDITMTLTCYAHIVLRKLTCNKYLCLGYQSEYTYHKLWVAEFQDSVHRIQLLQCDTAQCTPQR